MRGVVSNDRPYRDQHDQEFAAWICENISPDIIVRLESLKEPAQSTDLTVPLRHVGGDSEEAVRAFETAKRLQDAGLRDVLLPARFGPQAI